MRTKNAMHGVHVHLARANSKEQLPGDEIIAVDLVESQWAMPAESDSCELTQLWAQGCEVLLIDNGFSEGPPN
jgi:hypothetical protein